MLKRAVASVLSLVLLFEMTACSSIHRTSVTPDQLSGRRQAGETIVAVTLHSGEIIEYTRRARTRGSTRAVAQPQIANDSVYVTLEGGAQRIIPLSDVDRVWIERRSGDALKTIGAVIGVTAGLLLGLIIIVAATKESCPFVYSWDGTQFVFDAEPYGGAVTLGLERDDYAELENLRADDDTYRLRVTNEVNETQFTNLFEIWAVDHPIGTRVVADEMGRLHTLQAIVPPSAASDAEGRNLLPWLEATDRRIWEPMAVPLADGSVRQDIVLTFPRPAGANTAKLVANIATGLWGSHMIREMLALRGESVGQWYAAIDSNPASLDSLMAWNIREELYYLKLYVEEPTGWEFHATLPGGGPFIAEDRVVLIDVSRVLGPELRIRIQPPLGFWALNSFAVDYSQDADVFVTRVLPSSARDHRGADILGSLAAADDRYYEMPTMGDWAELTFPAVVPMPGVDRTMFLHSRGYYRLHLEETGVAQTALVQDLNETRDAAARFAAVRYAAWQLAQRQ